ncbi:MAG: tRNA (guanosine(46)-N7)-methyltransferase TrmB [Parahaliea sp.]
MTESDNKPVMTREQHIRSYVLRTGRMTDGQKRAFDNNWQRWGLDYSGQMEVLDQLFGADTAADYVLEIGFGMGQSLLTMAAAAPERRFIGIEVHKPGVGRLLHGMSAQNIDNIRVYCHDAVDVLQNCIPVTSLAAVHIFFPDPWHKKRHHKRRLIQTDFVALLVSRLKPGGILHLATDWQNYAEQMMAVLSANRDLDNSAGAGQFCVRPDYRPLTKFEQRGERLGHSVWDLVFNRCD